MKHEVLTSNGIPVQLVRYCKFQDKDCLIFTKETTPDAQGYVTIHISEVRKDSGLIGVAVEDNLANDIVKTIANEIKNGMPLSITDLNYNELDGINILSDKAFRVFPNYIDTLETNRQTFEAENNTVESSMSFDNNFGLNNESVNFNSNPFNIDMDTTPNENEESTSEVKDYQKLYEEQLVQMDILKNENIQLKEKIEQLKNILNS